MRMRKWVPTVALFVLLAPTVAFPQATTNQSGVYEELNLFGEAFERIRQDAVEPVTDGHLIETAIAGMLAGLDPQSVYLNETEYKALQAQQKEETGSTGLVVTLDSSQLKVVSPRDGSPAAEAGIKPGETIFSIDKEPVFDLTLTEVEQKLRGPAGSEVTLMMRNGTDAPSEVKVKRAVGKLPTVASHVEGSNIGYIRLAGFDDRTQAALQAAAQDLQQAGVKPIGYILDLRNNPGGNFDVAVAAADDFLDKGDITIVKSRKPGAEKHIAATPGDIASGLPIVALVNGGTAREAELVASALQDNHRAILVGSKTFGESSIQSILPLDGNGAVMLTTARFETPSGQPIQGKGLDPDLTVAPLKLERLASGFGQRESDLRGALKNTDLAAPGVASGAVSPATPTPVSPTTPAAPAKTPASPGAAATPGNPPAAPSSAPTPPKPETKSAVATSDLGSAQDEQLIQAIDVLRGLALVTARNGR
jgi:carboxyl-terminal processing protease